MAHRGRLAPFPKVTRMTDYRGTTKNFFTPGCGAKTIVKLLEGFRLRHGLDRVFRDCMAMSAIAVSNAVDLAQFRPREDRYLEIVGRYDREEIEVMCRVLAILAMELEAGAADVLGQVFGNLKLGNERAGQFFTPYEVSRLMARLQVADRAGLRATVDARGFVRAHEPAVGSGSMVIALAEAFAEEGIDIQRQLHVTAVDVDERAVHMAYLQLSLLHIPAVVYVGNSLSMEMREAWYTPAHVLRSWGSRLRPREAASVPQDEGLAPERSRGVDGQSQLVLF